MVRIMGSWVHCKPPFGAAFVSLDTALLRVLVIWLSQMTKGREQPCMVRSTPFLSR